MVKAAEVAAEVSKRLRINLFWMGKKPFAAGKTYFLKLGTAKIPCRLERINYLIDASESAGAEKKAAVERHDVADVRRARRRLRARRCGARASRLRHSGERWSVLYGHRHQPVHDLRQIVGAEPEAFAELLRRQPPAILRRSGHLLACQEPGKRRIRPQQQSRVVDRHAGHDRTLIVLRDGFGMHVPLQPHGACAIDGRRNAILRRRKNRRDTQEKNGDERL